MKTAFILLALLSVALTAPSKSPSRTPSPVPSPSSTPAPSCGGSGNCALFYAIQDSFYVENSAPSSDPNLCTFGYGSLNYTTTNYNPFWNRESVAQYQFDFTSIPSTATLTSIEVIVSSRKGCLNWGNPSCPYEGNGVNIYDTGSFNEATLIDTPAGWNCTAPPTIGSLKDSVTVSGCRITSTSAAMLAYAQSTVTNSVVAPIALISDTSNEVTYFCTKESGFGALAMITWNV